MALPTWPFGCPTTWDQKGKASTIRTEIEQGYPKQRPRFTKTYLVVSVAWVFRSWAEYSAVVQFLEGSIGGAALPFTMGHPISLAPMDWRFSEYPRLTASASSKPTFTLTGELEQYLA